MKNEKWEQSRELEMKLLIGLGFRLGFVAINIFPFPALRFSNIPDKTHFHNKGFARSLVSKVRFLELGHDPLSSCVIQPRPQDVSLRSPGDEIAEI